MKLTAKCHFYVDSLLATRNILHRRNLCCVCCYCFHSHRGWSSNLCLQLRQMHYYYFHRVLHVLVAFCCNSIYSADSLSYAEQQKLSISLCDLHASLLNDADRRLRRTDCCCCCCCCTMIICSCFFLPIVFCAMLQDQCLINMPFSLMRVALVV